MICQSMGGRGQAQSGLASAAPVHSGLRGPRALHDKTAQR